VDALISDQLLAWLDSADMTYCSSRYLFLSGNPYLWFDAAYLLHQALEKYAKALLYSIPNNRTLREHNLKKLFDILIQDFPDIDDKSVRKLINEIEHFATLRYADTTFTGESFGGDDLFSADLLVRMLRERIPYETVEKARKKFIFLPLEIASLNLVDVVLKNNEQADYWKKEFERK
jgi:HEPN domain-containing protein